MIFFIPQLSLCIASIYTTLFLSAEAPITVGCVACRRQPGLELFPSLPFASAHTCTGHTSKIQVVSCGALTGGNGLAVTWSTHWPVSHLISEPPHTHTHCRTHQQQKQSCCLDTRTDSSWCFVRVESLLVWADRILLPLHLRTACQYDSAHFCDLWPHRCWPFDTKTNWSL